MERIALVRKGGAGVGPTKKSRWRDEIGNFIGRQSLSEHETHCLI
jgi:hypothetical protein